MRLGAALAQVGANSLVSQGPHVVDLLGEAASRTVGRQREPVGDPARPPAVLEDGAPHRVLVEHRLERLAVRGGEGAARGVARAARGR